MPRIYHRMEETGYHILNPICEQVVNGFLDRIDALKYMKDSIYILHSMSSYSSTNDRNGGINLTKDRCDVTAQFILDPLNVPWPNLAPYSTPAYGMRTDFNGNHRSIFADDMAMVRLEEYTVPAAIEMDFKLTFQTFDAAMRCFDMLKILNAGTVSDATFDLSYAYPLTMSMNAMLMAVYQRKTDYKDKDYIQYLRDFQKNPINFDIRKSQLTEAHADTELMVRCQQLECQGAVTFDQSEPEVERVGNIPDKYILNFNLKLQFGRPIMVVGIVPIVVDNQFLPFNLFERDFSFNNPFVGGAFEDPNFDPVILFNYINYVKTNQLIRFPTYDDWIISDKLINCYKFNPLIIAAFTLDGPSTQIDLKQLDDVVLHPIVQNILKAEGSAVFSFESIFNLTVLGDTLRIDASLLSISDDLILTVNVDRPNAHYYLVLSETTDLKFLGTQWFDLLLKYRYFFPLSIERNLQFLVELNYIKVTSGNTLINLLSDMIQNGDILQFLWDLVHDGYATGDIYQYTHNATQLADYLSSIPSLNIHPPIPDKTVSGAYANAATYMTTQTDHSSMSLYNVVVTKLLMQGTITLDDIPPENFKTPDGYLYGSNQGGFSDFSTPLRILNYNYRG